MISKSPSDGGVTLRPTSIITSAAYVNLELEAEYGLIPPAFLPFGHQRLYQIQVKLLRQECGRCILTLPASFEIPAADEAWLHLQDVEIITLPDGLLLGDSIAQALILGEVSGAVHILHGDTLLPGFSQSRLNTVAVAHPQAGYRWGRLSQSHQNGTDDVLVGWFSISDAATLLRALIRKGGNFVAALDVYAETFPLDPVQVSEWLDFGHLQTFHRARTRVSTARAFNRLAITNRSVFKSGDKPDKLRNEAAWFTNIPPEMRIFTPTFMGAEESGYRIAYEYNPTLHELLIFGALEPGAWEAIAAGCFEFFGACRRFCAPSVALPGANVIRALATAKTEMRVAEWARTVSVDLDRPWVLNECALPSISQIVRETTALIEATTALPGVMHGDFCFPNIFFDFRQQIIKVIDPRGSVEDQHPSIYGDIRYDLAKLNHSIEGYDQILTGRYSCRHEGPYRLSFDLAPNKTVRLLRRIFGNLQCEEQSTADPGIQALTIQLFLSMLPLHADRPDRQEAFLANAFRIFMSLDDPRRIEK